MYLRRVNGIIVFTHSFCSIGIIDYHSFAPAQTIQPIFFGGFEDASGLELQKETSFVMTELCSDGGENAASSPNYTVQLPVP